MHLKVRNEGNSVGFVRKCLTIHVGFMYMSGEPTVGGGLVLSTELIVIV